MDEGEINKQLREQNELLKRENELLKAKIRELEARLAQYENAHTPPSLRRGRNRKISQDKNLNGNPGQKIGHKGLSRPYATPDREVEVTMDLCPNCVRSTRLRFPDLDQLSQKRRLIPGFLVWTLSGSGDIKLADLSAEKVSVMLSGSGNVILAGSETAAEFKATISGSGNIKSIDFPANDVSVKIVGSGNCWVNSVKNLVAKLAGSGNVIYRGNPLIDTSICRFRKCKERVEAIS